MAKERNKNSARREIPVKEVSHFSLDDQQYAIGSHKRPTSFMNVAAALTDVIWMTGLKRSSWL
jgi:hypothetical protein